MHTVLIAEDEMIEREFLVNLLNRLEDFHVVAKAGDGRTAVELAFLHRPDVAFLDIRMPLLDGLAAAGKIKKALPQTFIVLNSAFAEFKYAQQGIDCGVDAYLLKPSSESEIFSLLRSRFTPRPLERDGQETFRSLLDAFPTEAAGNFARALETKDGALCESVLSEIRASLGKNLSLNVYRLHVLNVLFDVMKACRLGSVSMSAADERLCDRILTRISQTPTMPEIADLANSCLDNILSAVRSSFRDSAAPIRRIVEFLDEHFREDVGAGDLKGLVFLSEDYVERLFRRTQRVSIQQYVNGKRLAEAERLLLQSRMTMQEISERSGFQNVSTFFRNFKKKYGLTPARYRKEKYRE